jgi:tetratricopeptide (TPR) repeat protein
MVYILINLGSLHQEWGQHKKALELYKSVEQISTDLNDALNLVKAVENIGIIHNELNEPDSALARFEFALVKAEQVSEPKRVSSIYNNMGYSWELKENFKLARYFYEKALNLRKKNEDVDDIASSLNNLGRITYKMKDYQKAIGYILQSNHLAIYAATRIDNYKLLSDIYSILNNPSLALVNYKLYAELRDSIFTNDKHKLIQELQTKYETEKKEQEIATLSAEKEIEMLKNQQSGYYIFALIAFLLLITSGGLLLLRYVRINAQHRTIELEQRLLRSQMNPHFIFNALSCIQEFMMSKNPLEASSYLSNFAKLMRAILNNSSKEFILLSDEIETLKHYLELQKLRYPDKLEYELNIAHGLNTEELMIPPMLAQPFIENAVIHGIAKKNDGPGKLIVEFMSQETNLFLYIRDNGPGMKKNELHENNSHQSMSIQITNSRINNFKKAYKRKVEFKIRNLNNENNESQGVEVFFSLPKISSNNL